MVILPYFGLMGKLMIIWGKKSRKACPLSNLLVIISSAVALISKSFVILVIIIV